MNSWNLLPQLIHHWAESPLACLLLHERPVNHRTYSMEIITFIIIFLSNIYLAVIIIFSSFSLLLPNIQFAGVLLNIVLISFESPPKKKEYWLTAIKSKWPERFFLLETVAYLLGTHIIKSSPPTLRDHFRPNFIKTYPPPPPPSPGHLFFCTLLTVPVYCV